MSPSREYPRWAPLGPVLLQLFGCTLTGDAYEPQRVDVVLPAEDAGPRVLPAAMLQPAAAPEAPAPAPERPDAAVPSSCTGSSELPGCELRREDPSPPASVACSSDRDCSSRHCSGGSCVAASCSDGILNQGESAADCGGPCPARCGEGDACRSSEDCGRGLSCPVATQQCAQPSCRDGVQNGSETGPDCGGGICPGCAGGSPCGAAEDCASGVCGDGVCSSASCDDLVRNQDETDTDCGGVCRPCAPGQGCALDTECQSGACQDGRCCGGQEVDCTRCARRLATTINCNSNGASAEAAAACTDFLQCLTDHAGLCPRRFSPGCTDPGGVCDAASFGGGSSAGITLADGILGTAQCNF